MVSLLEEVDRLKSDPRPERFAVCELFAALSLTVKVPLRVPVTVGVNVTLIVQLELAANDAGTIVGLPNSLPVI